MLNDRMQTAISFYKEASAKKMLVSGDNLNEDYDEVSVMKKLAVSGGIEADEVYMDHTLNTYDTIVHSLEFFNKGSTIVNCDSKLSSLPRTLFGAAYGA